MFCLVGSVFATPPPDQPDLAWVVDQVALDSRAVLSLVRSERGEASLEWMAGSAFDQDGQALDREGLDHGRLIEVVSGIASSAFMDYSVRYYATAPYEPVPIHPETPLPVSPVDEDLAIWQHDASPEAVIRVIAGFDGWNVGALPRADPGFLEPDPVFFLEASLARVLALEEAQNLTEALTLDARTRLADLGCASEATGISGQLVANVTALCLDELMHHPDVQTLSIQPLTEPDRNDGLGIRDGHQIQQFLDNGLNGELGSGRSAFGDDMLIGIVDQTIDPNHPAWRDTSNPATSRLRAIRCWLGNGNWNGGYYTPSTNVPYNSNDQHGTRVAGQAVADLTQNQHGNQGATWEKARTGMSTESHMVFYGIRGMSQNSTPTTGSIVQKEIADGVDILSRSYGPIQPVCGVVHSSQINPLFDEFKNGVFHVNSAGNNGSTAGCNIGGHAAHPAVFTVGALRKNDGDLRSAGIASYSSIGGDGWGRNLVDMVAIGGRQTTTAFGSGTLASYDDTYGCTTACVGTSFAAPIVAGAAANLKHQLVNKLGAATINQPGRMHALMLLMGDRQTQAGKSSIAMDPHWGAGRLTMRKFNHAGMDFPFAFHSARVVLSQGQKLGLSVSTGSVLLGASNPLTNPALPTDVDELRVVAWWYEPSAASAADIRLRIRKVSSSSFIAVTSSNAAPGQRRAHTSAPNGGTWEIQLTGVDVPVGGSPNLAIVQGQRAREVHVAWFWEDSDRDDANGPPSDIR